MSIEIAHLFVCTVPIPECWNETKDVHRFGGVAHNVTSLDECKAKCIDISSCVAIDWQPSSAGESCWTLTYAITRETSENGSITNYALNRSCLR